jgi:predicted RNase H-like HicB family nuclease
MSVNKRLESTHLPLREQNIFKKPNSNIISGMAKRFSATFNVHVDKDGYLCAADMDQGIFTDGKDREELLRNINEAVECHFDVPHDQVNIRIVGLS